MLSIFQIGTQNIVSKWKKLKSCITRWKFVYFLVYFVEKLISSKLKND